MSGEFLIGKTMRLSREISNWELKVIGSPDVFFEDVQRRLKSETLSGMASECRKCPLKTIKSGVRQVDANDSFAIDVTAKCNATGCAYSETRGKTPAASTVDYFNVAAPRRGSFDEPAGAYAGDW